MSEGADKPGQSAGPQSEAGAESRGAPRWAADEPTAMWDESALRDQGFADAAEAARAASGPATAPRVGGDDRATVQAPTMPAPTLPAPTMQATPRASAPSGGGLSWPLTIAIACVVAVVVYFAVRLLVQ